MSSLKRRSRIGKGGMLIKQKTDSNPWKIASRELWKL
jgi:hypothetical protein